MFTTDQQTALDRMGLAPRLCGLPSTVANCGGVVWCRDWADGCGVAIMTPTLTGHTVVVARGWHFADKPVTHLTAYEALRATNLIVGILTQR